MDVASLLQGFILYVVIPAWLCAGLADWACHRATDIETTGGTKESLLHAAQLSEVGLPLLLALFFEINAVVIAGMIFGLLLHQATAMWDVRWASPVRTIPPVEQHVHSVLEMAPVMVFAGLAILSWPAVLDLGDGHLSISLRPKEKPLPAAYLTAFALAVLTMGVVPYGEELVRCLRAARARSS
jgi:hypothetical protein